MARVDVKDLSVTYLLKKGETVRAISSFSASFPSGEISVILGSSGCGKTTLLRAIAQQFEYDGTIYIDGKDIDKTKAKDKNIAYVDQNIFLFGNMIVYDILAFPLKQKRIKADEIDRRVKEMADILEIGNLLTRKPKQLSLGQRQKVALGKALIKKPDVCLLDEPFSNLDVESKKQIFTYIKKIENEFKMTVILVTHNIDEAMTIGDHIYYLKDSRIEFCLTPEELGRSARFEALRGLR